MKKSIKKLVSAFLFVGCMLFSMMGLTACGKTVIQEHVISEPFENITIITKTSDVVIVPISEEQAKVECQDLRSSMHKVAVQNDTLTISLEDHDKWYNNFFTQRTLIRIYLPQKEYGALNIDGSTGDVVMTTEHIFSSVNIDISTGDVESCVSAKENFTVTGSTGNVSIDRASVGSLDIEMSTGEVFVNVLECMGNVKLKTSTGDIVASQVKCAGDMRMDVSTGRVEYMDGACKSLTTAGSTGKLVMSGVEVSETIDIERSTGDVYVGNCKANILKVITSTGNISVYEGAYGTMQLSVDTGETEITDLTCASLTTTGKTGELYMSNVIASGGFTIKRSTGDVEFERCDAAELLITTSTGDVEGSLLSDKVFIHNTNTGEVQLPETVTGGKCKITTDTGDIEITIEND